MRSSHTETLIEVAMPKMGISVSEGTILEWRKQPGDWIEADETIADVTTDKVDVEIPRRQPGGLARIIAEPGDTVPVGRRSPRSTRRRSRASASGGVRSPQSAVRRIRGGRSQQSTDHPEPQEASGGETDRSGFVSPVVRRIAEKHDVDLEQVQGTGIGGRVRKTDVLAYVEANGGDRGQAKPAPSCTPSPRTGPRSPQSAIRSQQRWRRARR